MLRMTRAALYSLIAVLAGFGIVGSFAALAPLSFPLAEDGSGPPPAGSTADAPFAGETYAWRPVAIGGGGYITGLSTDPAGKTFVARTDVYGAYVWEPARNRWEQLVDATSMPAADRRQDGANEGVYEIAVAPSDPNRLYMAIAGGLYRSTDRGVSWTRGALPQDKPLRFDPNGEFRRYGPFLWIDPASPDIVLFGSPEDGAWRSADGGRHWAQVGSLPPSADLRPQPGIQAPGALFWQERGEGGTATGRVWAFVGGHGMFVSSDHGASFAPLPTQGPGPTLLKQGAFTRDGRFFAVDSEHKHVWRYAAGRWDDITATSGLKPLPYASVAIDPADDTIWVFDEGGHPYRSGNGGTSWWPVIRRVRVGAGDPPWLHVADQSYVATGMAMFDPVVRGRLWIASGVGPMYGDAPARLPYLSLTTQARGIEQIVATDVVQPTGGAPLFAGWDFGIHRKPDLDRFSTTYGPKERVLIAAQQLAWNTADPRFVVTNASDTRMSCCSKDGDAVLAGYSTDGGRSWSKFATLPQPPGTKADDPWRMAFGTIAVAADDTANIIWEPSFDRSPFYTRDRGATWQRVVLPGERLPDTGSHGAYYLPRKTLTADRVAPGTFYLVHSGTASNPGLTGLWRTADGGAHWNRVLQGEIAPGSRYAAKLRAVPGHAGHLFFTSGASLVPDSRLRRSLDGGATWTTLDTVNAVDDIGFGKPARGGDYPAIYVSGKVRGTYGIWRSTDNAASWTRLAGFPLGKLDQAIVVEGDKDVFGRVYVGYKGSGWVYGEPAPCRPAPFSRAASEDCTRAE